MSATAHVAIDGVLVPADRATVSVFDRGFLYGDSVFDTTRTYRGELFKLPQHIARLAESAGKMGFTLPISVHDGVAEVTRLVDEVRAHHGGGEWVARFMVTRGHGPIGLDPTLAADPRRVLYIHELHLPPAEAYKNGVGVITYPTFRPSDAAQGAKVGNYLESVLAIRHAKAKDAHEALILTHDGHVVEGTTTNVFAIRGQTLLTPPASETLLLGITRGLVLQVATSVGLTIEERRLLPTDLIRADETFVTSSVRELLPVSCVDGHVIGKGTCGPVTRALHEAFRTQNELPSPAPWE